MRTFLFLALLSVSAVASASLPTGRKYGHWDVVSVSGLSGAEGNDASVILAQGEEPNILQVRWVQGGPVVVSINVEKCLGEEDFEASYSIESKRWLQLSRRDIQMRLRTDMAAWLHQAMLACEPNPALKTFSLDSLDKAASDFEARLRYFAGAE